MPTTPRTADPLRSAGARTERKALRAYLRRRLARDGWMHKPTVDSILAWVLGRQKRYDARPGGL